METYNLQTLPTKAVNKKVPKYNFFIKTIFNFNNLNESNYKNISQKFKINWNCRVYLNRGILLVGKLFEIKSHICYHKSD